MEKWKEANANEIRKEHETLKIPERFWKDDIWLENNFLELSKVYKDEWIAVVNKSVAAHGKNLSQVKKEARKKTGVKYVSTAFIEGGAHVY